MKRVVAYLRGAVPGSSRGPASLAVVAVDDAQVVAQAFASLAASYAAEGKQVVVADLSGGAYLARLLRVSDPGIRTCQLERREPHFGPAAARGRRAGGSGARRGLPGGAGTRPIRRW